MHAPRRPAQSSSLCRVAPQPFFAYVAPHAPHTRASPAPGSDGYFHDWQVCFSCHGRPRPPPWLMQLLSHFLFLPVVPLSGFFQPRASPHLATGAADAVLEHFGAGPPLARARAGPFD